jgi:hypothetical protein
MSVQSFKRVAALALLIGAAWHTRAAQAGVFELSANGFYFLQNFGLIEGQKSYEISQRYGGGLAYHFTESTSIELQYMHSKTIDVFGFSQTDSMGQNLTYLLNTNNDVQNLSLNLVLDIMGKNSAFRPYVMGGGGYMIRKKITTGKQLATDLSPEQQINAQVDPETRSASADAGLGFKIAVAEHTAIDLAGTLYATDLDKPQIYLHYSVTGGLRFIF